MAEVQDSKELIVLVPSSNDTSSDSSPSKSTDDISSSDLNNNNATAPLPLAPVVPCFVCGDRSSGRHYGVLTCDGCRGFFKRSVRRGLGYQCREKGQCVVDLSRRNQCQSCRFKKCLGVGMRQEAVQHERAPRNNKNNKHQQHNGQHHLMRNDFSPYPQQIIYHRIPIIPGDPVDIPPPVTVCANVPLERAKTIHQQQQQQQRHQTPVQLPPTTHQQHQQSRTKQQSISIKSPTELYEVCARILYEAISWARNIPTFSQLPLDDQALLLEYSWSEIFLLNLAQLNVPLAMETMIKLTQQNKEFQNDRSDIDKETLNELVHIQSVVFKLKTLNMTSSEYSCVKAIVLFKPDLRRIKSRQHVENLQEQAQLRLHDSILAKGPRSRFGKILLKLSLLGEVSPSFIEKCFFKGGLENVSDDFQKSPFSDENQTNEKTSSVVESNISNQSKERTDTHNKSKEINKSCNQLGEKSETHNQPAEPSIVSPVNKSTTPAEVASQSEEDAIPEHDQSKDCVDELILASIKQEEIDEIEIVI